MENNYFPSPKYLNLAQIIYQIPLIKKDNNEKKVVE